MHESLVTVRLPSNINIEGVLNYHGIVETAYIAAHLIVCPKNEWNRENTCVINQYSRRRVLFTKFLDRQFISHVKIH